jgi:hypothetical protein
VGDTLAELQASSLRYVLRVTTPTLLVNEPEVLHAFAKTRPHALQRFIAVTPGATGTEDTGTAAARRASLVVWSAPLSRWGSKRGVPPSLLTVVEKSRRAGVEPLCLHLVTSERADTKARVAAVLDAYLASTTDPARSAGGT